MIRHFFTKQFLFFLATGGIAAIVNFSSRIFYNQWTSFSTAVIIAYCTGMVTAFILAKIFVFKKSQRATHHSAFIFIMVNIVAIAQTWAISMFLDIYGLPWLGVTKFVPEIAHSIGIMSPVFSSFILHKHWTFSEYKIDKSS